MTVRGTGNGVLKLLTSLGGEAFTEISVEQKRIGKNLEVRVW